MSDERVGYRRLYDSAGCSLAGRDELRLTVDFLDDVRVELYQGPRPRFGIWVGRGEKYVVPGERASLQGGTYHADASASSYPRRFFTEVFCSIPVDVPREVADGFHRDEAEARDCMLKLAEANELRLRRILDLVVGVIGLRFHRQFVLELLDANPVALRGDKHAMTHYGSALEVLEPLSLNETGMAHLEATLRAISSAPPDTTSSASLVLRWLMRAWGERDAVNKFIALFVPLEMLLEGYGSGGASERSPELVESIRGTIRRHGGDAAHEMLHFFDGLVARQRPTLNERFEAMARQANLQGWESDVTAFGKFNRFRNALLHRGDDELRLHVSIGEDDVQSLEDIVERYVSVAFFGDAGVYPSRWRPRRPVGPGGADV